jgi:hypothetical protein
MIKAKARGIRIRHNTKRSGMALLPIYHKPLYGDSVHPCPNCKITHTDSYGNAVKTVHLWLDDTGAGIVSKGVYDDLNQAGHFLPVGALPPLLKIIADIVNPPAIVLGRNRFEVDQKNNRIRYWKEPVING